MHLSITSSSPRGRGCRQLSHHASLASQTHTQKPRLGVTESWRANGPSRSPRRCQWDRSARRSASIGPGRQRNPPTIWSWHGWSGCAQPKQRGAAFTTSTELSSGPSWRGAKGWSLSTFPSARSRKDTRRSCSKKAAAWRSLRRLVAQAVGNLAAWRKGRTSLHTPQRSVRTVASISFRLGFSITGSSDTRLTHCSHQGELDRPGQAGHAFHHGSHAASDQCCGGRFGALLAAIDRHQRRRHCGPRTGESRCYDLHSKRSAMCARHT